MPGEAQDYLPGRGVDLVVVRAAGDEVVPILGETAFNLQMNEEPHEDLLSELLGSTVRITLTEGLPTEVLERIESVPVPPAFQASPWLADSRPAIVRHDGTGYIGNVAVCYTDVQGLQILHPEPEPVSDDDEEWEA